VKATEQEARMSCMLQLARCCDRLTLARFCDRHPVEGALPNQYGERKRPASWSTGLEFDDTPPRRHGRVSLGHGTQSHA